MKVLYNHIQPDTPVTTLKRWSDTGAKIDLPCPQAIHDYFYHARSVDVLNQLHYNYIMGRKSKHSSTVYVWWLIDMAVVNAYTLHRIGREGVSQLDFRLELMHDLVRDFEVVIGAERESGGARRNVALAKDHYSERSDKQRACKQCYDKHTNRKEVWYVCAACKVHLCVGKCFGWYHAEAH
jgi:hypothetical protein